MSTFEERYVRGDCECPHCGERDPSVRRQVGEGRPTSAYGRIGLGVPCYCARCNFGWVEWYRLESVEWQGKERL